MGRRDRSPIKNFWLYAHSRPLGRASRPLAATNGALIVAATFSVMAAAIAFAGRFL